MRVVSHAVLRFTVVGLALAVGVSSLPSRTGAEPPKEPTSSKKVLTVERIFSDPPLVSAAPSGIEWLPDSRGITYLSPARKDGQQQTTRLVLREVPSGKERTLCVVDTARVPSDLKRSDPDTLRIQSYHWAEKGDVMMFTFRDEIFTFNRKNGEIRRRTQNDKPEENATFSPDATKIAFTRDNDIWVVDVQSRNETQLTATGSDTVMNGVLDWVYTEELFTRGDTRAFWWSPDSKRIAFLQLDESPVPRFPIVDFIPVLNTTEMQYYPKPGDPNPVARVGVMDVSTGETAWIKLDTTDDSYIPRVHWLRDGTQLAVEKLNRNQDKLELYLADVRSGEAWQILAETSDSWIDIGDLTRFDKTDDRFVWSSDRDGYRHLYLYGNDGTLVKPLTSGTWEVSDLQAVDEKDGVVYFTGNEKSVLERHLYRVSEKDGKLTRLTQREGNHAVTFSPDSKYYYDRFSSVVEPRLITVHAASGKELFTLDKAVTAELDSYDLPTPEFSTFTSKDGATIHCSMYKPRDFDPAKRYPVLVYTYGYPNSQVILNQWGRSTQLWHAMLAQKGFIVFSLDGRGAYGYGKAWAAAALKRIGLSALDDHVAAAQYLHTLPYVDGTRIGIWGWSGGGAMTVLAMLKTPGVFKAGAAVAPVTDWRFYDSIYTERYMKSPKENEEGYRESSPVNFASKLEGKLLLVHGTADDNVHMQNSVVLVSKLIKEGKDFDLAIYPGGGHGIGGNKARAHLFTKLTRFFEENL